mmetsp:Transcript_49261/g.96641  ORF Transcript_49261/g.96641 Transcript_49261/m.96641 type:complete len:215 (+) Transcript_49261:48-692(+)
MGNLFGSLFGKKPTKNAGDISEHDKAVLQLKRQRDRLIKYRKQAEKVLAREVEMAKALVLKGDKKKALLCLKKKKYQQQCIEKTETQMMNLEEMVNSIEFASMRNEFLKAYEEGKNALDYLNSQTSLEDVEKLMEDTAEAIAYQDEVNQALNGALTSEDEEAIAAELAMIEEMEAAEQVAGMVDAPTKPVQQQQEEAEPQVMDKKQTASEVVLA